MLTTTVLDAVNKHIIHFIKKQGKQQSKLDMKKVVD